MLPQPNGPFEWVQAAGAPALVCAPLTSLARHLFTTRAWALGAPAADREAAWADVARSVGVDPARLVRPHQVHGARAVVAQADAERPDADIMVSNNRADAPPLAIAVQTADCMPLLIADARTGAVAAAHAGWRGLVARVPAAAVEALAREFGSRPADLIAAAGPSIGACCYEVGDEVRVQFLQAGFSEAALTRWFSGQARPTTRNPSMPGLTAPRAGHWYFDGWTAAREMLTASGVPADRIHVAELCSASHPAAFCSYRRDGKGVGRMAAAIGGRFVMRRPEVGVHGGRIR